MEQRVVGISPWKDVSRWPEVRRLGSTSYFLCSARRKGARRRGDLDRARPGCTPVSLALAVCVVRSAGAPSKRVSAVPSSDIWRDMPRPWECLASTCTQLERSPSTRDSGWSTFTRERYEGRSRDPDVQGPLKVQRLVERCRSFERALVPCVRVHIHRKRGRGVAEDRGDSVRVNALARHLRGDAVAKVVEMGA